MPQIRKQATIQIYPKGDMSVLVREAKNEAAQAGEVAKATRLIYEGRAKQLVNGWDLESACKNSRYVVRAAGLWTMRRQLRRKLKDALKTLKSGITGKELMPVRMAIFGEKMKDVEKLLLAIRVFQALPWDVYSDPKRRLQKSHKKSAAKDAELVLFYKAAQNSSFLVPMMVAEFSGVRGDEFGKGVRVEVGKKGGIATLRFTIESAKADGNLKGLDLRCVEAPFPSGASREVKQRWLKLAKIASEGGKSFTVRIEPTEKMTSGQRFTQACKFVAKKAGVDISAYSMRHRVSAQAKQSNGGDAVAVAIILGHQTTETQRHYGRATRGGGGISPVQLVGVNVSGQTIRGAPKREGPRIQTKIKVDLAASVPDPGRSHKSSNGPRL